MARKTTPGLTGREAQILGALWQQGALTVGEIRLALPDPPTSNTVRKLLSIMCRRRLVEHDGSKYGKRFQARVEQGQARIEALGQLVQTHYAGKGGDVITDLLAGGLLTRRQLRAVVKRFQPASEAG
jgi:predicted transcriptional regulator